MTSPVNELHREAVMADGPNAAALAYPRYDAGEPDAVITPAIEMNNNEAFPSAPNSIRRFSIVKSQIATIAGEPTVPGALARDKRRLENIMRQWHWNGVLLVSALLIGGSHAYAQSPGAVQLRIDIEKTVNYYEDITDYSKFAVDPGPKAVAPSSNFSAGVSLADIVAVNGEPVKGTAFGQQVTIVSRPNAAPGQAIADVFSGGPIEWILEIQSATDAVLDEMGRPFSIGTIVVRGLAGDARPAGVPIVGGGNFAVIGGTGAFVGARGQAVFNPPTAPARAASYGEDPANRRNLAGGTFRFWVNLIPMTRPEILVTRAGPAVLHSSNNSFVNDAAPAQAGELLTLYATGCGPTRPAIDPGQQFQSSPLSTVQSPLRLTVNGDPAEVIYAGGYPGTEDTYQINFRMPPNVAPGSAALQLTSAWIPGKEVPIIVR